MLTDVGEETGLVVQEALETHRCIPAIAYRLRWKRN